MYSNMFSTPWKKSFFHCQDKQIFHFSKRYGFFSKHPLVGRVSSKKSDTAAVSKILEYVAKEILEPKFRLILTSEILTKILAYRDLKLKERFLIPRLDNNGASVSTYYEVDHVFDLWHGIPSFSLLPLNRDAHPILLFRGTDISLNSERSLFSIISDLDPKGPGFSTFLKARALIHAYLKELKKSYLSFRVMGYSLGGAFAAYVALFEQQFVTRNIFEPSVTFNPVGIAEELKKQYRKAKRKALIINFKVKNDPVSKIGNLIGSSYLLDIPEKFINPIKAHVMMMSAEDIFSCSKSR